MNTPRVDFTLQTITPLFLSGAEQTPELRPASVRGALRYWLRALTDAGNVSQLQEAESAVFGQTDFGSPVIVRLSGTPQPMTDFDLKRDESKINKHGVYEQLQNSGHNYLYYSTKLGMHKPDGNNRVPYKPAESFTLSLRLNPSSAKQTDLLLRANRAMWCLTNLGGLGSRAHRCAGNIKVSACSSHNLNENLSELFPTSATTTLTELKTHLETVLQSIKRATRSSKYDVIHPDECRVWVFTRNEWKKWEDVVEFIGKEMKTFRAVQANRNTINSVFGVPILHGGPGFPLNRRSSPLWLKVGQFSDGKYYGVATLFKSEFTQGNATVGGGYGHIENFITTRLATTSSNGQEVIYK